MFVNEKLLVKMLDTFQSLENSLEASFQVHRAETVVEMWLI